MRNRLLSHILQIKNDTIELSGISFADAVRQTNRNFDYKPTLKTFVDLNSHP